MFERVARNTAYLTIAQVIGELLNFVLFIILTRVYGEINIGKYGFAMSIAVILGAVADFGYREYTIKVMAQNLEQAKSILGNIIGLRIVFTLTAMLFLAIGSFSFSISDSTRIVLLSIGAYQLIVGLGQIFISEIKAHEDMKLIIKLVSIHRGVIFLIGIVAILLRCSFTTVMLVFPLGGVIFLSTCLYFSYARFGSLSWGFDIKEMIRSLKEAGHFFLNTIFSEVYSRSASLFLAAMIGEAAVGIYTMASKPVIAIGMFASFFCASFYPAMVKAFKYNANEVAHAATSSIRYLIISLFPIVTGFAIFSSEISRILYGTVSDDIAKLMKVIPFYIGLVSVNTLLRYILFSMNRYRLITFVQTPALALSIILNIIFISFAGVMGAALAAILTEFYINFMLMMTVAKEFSTISLTDYVYKPLLAAGTSVVILFVFINISHIFAAVLSFGTYIAVLFQLKSLTLNDISQVRQLLHRKRVA
jgi:O-antigen/teichoic acid export membrane protein